MHANFCRDSGSRVDCQSPPQPLRAGASERRSRRPQVVRYLWLLLSLIENMACQLLYGLEVEKSQHTLEQPLAAPAQQPHTAQLTIDERFWREAISTWRRLLQSSPQNPGYLHYLQSCHAKLAEVLELLGRTDEATEENDAVVATKRLLQAARSKSTAPFNMISALASLAFVGAAAISLVFARTPEPRAQHWVLRQESSPHGTERTTLVVGGNAIDDKGNTANRTRNRSGVAPVRQRKDD